jgi:hypothetical protein
VTGRAASERVARWQLIEPVASPAHLPVQWQLYVGRRMGETSVVGSSEVLAAGSPKVTSRARWRSQWQTQTCRATGTWSDLLSVQRLSRRSQQPQHGRARAASLSGWVGVGRDRRADHRSIRAGESRPTGTAAHHRRHIRRAGPSAYLTDAAWPRGPTAAARTGPGSCPRACRAAGSRGGLGRRRVGCRARRQRIQYGTATADRTLERQHVERRS